MISSFGNVSTCGELLRAEKEEACCCAATGYGTGGAVNCPSSWDCHMSKVSCIYT